MSFNTHYVLGLLCPVCKIQLRFSVSLGEPRHAPEGAAAAFAGAFALMGPAAAREAKHPQGHLHP